MEKSCWKVSFKEFTPGTVKPAIVYADSMEAAKAEGFAVWRNRNGSDAGFDWSSIDEVIAGVELVA